MQNQTRFTGAARDKALKGAVRASRATPRTNRDSIEEALWNRCEYASSALTAWRAAGLPIPTEYVADQLLLHLIMIPADEALSESQALKLSTGSIVPPDCGPDTAQELDR